MTDQLDRLETAFADRYRIEREGGDESSWSTTTPVC
jgi:hypothetical protein